MFYSLILFSRIAHLGLSQFHKTMYDLNVINQDDFVIIYLHHGNHCLNLLVNYFLGGINKPFVVISGMEDTTFPIEFNEQLINKVMSHPHFKHWFAINCIVPNSDKITKIPYGLDYWTVATRNYFGEEVHPINDQDSILQTISKNSKHFKDRIPKIYSNFHNQHNDGRNGRWRKRIKDENLIPVELIYYEPNFLKRSESWNEMTKYMFVVSPYGNGIDCIRTMEALCLGCIVILMKHPVLDNLYDDLPVVFVDKWSDINQKFLDDTLEKFSNMEFNYSKLKMDYWVKLVASKFGLSDDSEKTKYLLDRIKNKQSEGL